MSNKHVIFHRGTHKLELDMTQLNNGLDFPEDTSKKQLNHKKQHELFKRFVEDVTKFEEKVNESTRPYYQESTNRIIDFLRAPKNTQNAPISVFMQNDDLTTIRTALVQCNFTDISRFIGDFSRKLKNLDREEEENEEEENDAIHTVIDRISNLPSSIGCALIVQQFESLRSQTLDSIISLIYSNPSIRKRIHNIYLIVCVSTSCTFFTTTCSIDTLNLLDIQQFQFARLDEIFENIITTNIKPAIFSGKFLDYLRTRFFSCDYSVSSLIKAVQFAFLQKYVSDPFWREDDCEMHTEELENYFEMLNFFRKEVLRNETEKGKLHIEIQANEQFWKNIEESMEFRQWKQFIFDAKSNESLEMVLDNLRQLNLDEGTFKNLERLVKNLESSSSEDVSPTKSTTPSKTMKFSELRKKNQEALQAKQNNPVRNAKTAIFNFVFDLFKKTLQPYPSTWRNVIGLENSSQNDLFCRVGLDANDEFDIENALLENVTYKNEAISVAWRTLLTHKNFKCVPLFDWANDFVKKYKSDSKTRKEAFFGAAGQLEHIGLIRGGADKKNTTINVLYHPISHIAHI
ncbi:unnamed protein product [Caenorhabditis angaria]|uniref:Origin recognition complex subunit 3 N-terminal domain-containing protein n=1 Tax=Caenorhabditis angaria TaxID=860376 RepID=A0A9P1IHF5_9PELO|nr:unnamed protein product [Caenorhabditis angaria]